MIWYSMFTFIYTYLIFNYFGIVGLFYYFVIAFVANLEAETIQYVEHYGLLLN